MNYFFLFYFLLFIYSDCLNGCSGHGYCNLDNSCTCDENYGFDVATNEVIDYKWTGVDCSLKTCPKNFTWTETESGNSLFYKKLDRFNLRLLKNTEPYLPSDGIAELLFDADIWQLHTFDLGGLIECFNEDSMRSQPVVIVSLGFVDNGSKHKEFFYKQVNEFSDYTNGMLLTCRLVKVREDITTLAFFNVTKATKIDWEVILFNLGFSNMPITVYLACVNKDKQITKYVTDLTRTDEGLFSPVVKDPESFEFCSIYAHNKIKHPDLINLDYTELGALLGNNHVTLSTGHKYLILPSNSNELYKINIDFHELGITDYMRYLPYFIVGAKLYILHYKLNDIVYPYYTEIKDILDFDIESGLIEFVITSPVKFNHKDKVGYKNLLVVFGGGEHGVVECSNAGTCDRETGTCVCKDGYSGKSCENSILILL